MGNEKRKTSVSAQKSLIGKLYLETMLVCALFVGVSVTA